MKNKIIKIITIIAIVISGLFLVANEPAFADNACNKLDPSNPAYQIYDCGSGTNDKIGNVVGNIISAVIGILGLVAVVFIVMGGVQYMTSAGDTTKTKKAKDTILYACIGLAIAALAFTITQIAINTINGSDCTYDPATGTCV